MMPSECGESRTTREDAMDVIGVARCKGTSVFNDILNGGTMAEDQRAVLGKNSLNGIAVFV
jgi:hypothetical protein